MMNLTKQFGAALIALTACASGVALAADVRPASPPAANNNTITIEANPEWKTSNGVWVDDELKLGFAHTFDNNIVWGGSFTYIARDTNSADQFDSSLGYKFKSGAFTLTPSVLLGYRFGDQPRIDRTDNFAAEAYYAVSIAADVKLDDHWTWNAVNARYRNAFNVTWITPKVSTGITYKIDGTSSIYANVGYAWKDNGNGAGLLGDKYNVAVGYKFSF